MRLKKWQVITLVAFAILDLIVLGIGFAIVAMPNTGATPAPVAAHSTVAPVPPTVAPEATAWSMPTQQPKFPILPRLGAYPHVESPELVKRAYAYKGKPVCIDGVTAFNVQESSDGTEFKLQMGGSPYTVIGTAVYFH